MNGFNYIQSFHILKFARTIEAQNFVNKQNTDLCIAEVEVDGFGVTYMEDTVRFGWKPRHNLAAGSLQVILQDVHRLGRDHVTVRFVILT